MKKILLDDAKIKIILTVIFVVVVKIIKCVL